MTNSSILKADRNKVNFFISKLMPAMSDESQKSTIKMILGMAKEDGLNPEPLYKLALDIRPEFDAPAPSPEDIFPL